MAYISETKVQMLILCNI